jgi:alkanesulfonate monooxygenase SsuD/methylene tetrahydromethanopterin reductase-like flavin-dependent oxidoreductase (luciferase family)
MQFGLMTEPQLGMTYDTLLGLAQWADRTGLDAFARSDHYSFMDVVAPHATDAFATLSGLARETQRVDLVVLVSPITFRHPAVIAKMAATIDEMSSGRLRLGLGTGWMNIEHEKFGIEFFDQGERFSRLEEALAYMHHAFGRVPGPFHGDFYRLEETEVHPRPTGDLPIIVGGQGPKRTPRLAGEFGDEFNFVPRPDEEVVARIEHARASAERAGRDPGDLMISAMVAAIAGTDPAAFRDNLERMAAADPFGRTAEAIESRYRERGFPVGTADEVQATIAHYGELGFDRVYIQHFGPYDLELLDDMFKAVRG